MSQQHDLKESEIPKLLVRSAFLDLRDYVTLCWMLRKPKDWIEFTRYYSPPTSGSDRLRFWIKALKSVVYSEVFFMRQAIAETEQLEDPTCENFYERCLEKFDFTEINNFSSGIVGEIVRDVMRTYQTMKLFKEGNLGHSMLTHILFAVSIGSPDVGYCQGMNFVAATLICSRLNVFDGDQDPPSYSSEDIHAAEKEVFQLMLHLIDKHGKLGLQGLWAEKIPKLKLRVYQLDRFLRWNYPHLHEHFVQINLSPEVLTAQWFVTLFSYSFPSAMTIRLWDYIFLAGWEGIFRLAVSILGLMQEPLLALEDMESVALLMREWKKPGYLAQFFSFEALLAKAATLIINEEVLLKLQESFAQEVLSMAVIISYYHDHPEEGKDFQDSPMDLTQTSVMKKALPVGVEPPTFWLMRYGYKLSSEQAKELQKIYQQILVMDQQIDRDKQVLQGKILRACEFHQVLENHILEVYQIINEITEQLLAAQQIFHGAVQDAQVIALKASTIIDALGDHRTGNSRSNNNTTHKGQNNSHSPSSSSHNNTTTTAAADDVTATEEGPSTTSSTTTTIASTTGPTNSSSMTWKILNQGPLRKLLFRRRMTDAKQMTESLNQVLQHVQLQGQEEGEGVELDYLEEITEEVEEEEEEPRGNLLEDQTRPQQPLQTTIPASLAEGERDVLPEEFSSSSSSVLTQSPLSADLEQQSQSRSQSQSFRSSSIASQDPRLAIAERTYSVRVDLGLEEMTTASLLLADTSTTTMTTTADLKISQTNSASSNTTTSHNNNTNSNSSSHNSSNSPMTAATSNNNDHNSDSNINSNSNSNNQLRLLPPVPSSSSSSFQGKRLSYSSSPGSSVHSSSSFSHDPPSPATATAAASHLSKASSAAKRRKSYLEQEEEHVKITEKCRRLTLKIEQFAASGLISHHTNNSNSNSNGNTSRSQRFSFSGDANSPPTITTTARASISTNNNNSRKDRAVSSETSPVEDPSNTTSNNTTNNTSASSFFSRHTKRRVPVAEDLRSSSTDSLHSHTHNNMTNTDSNKNRRGGITKHSPPPLTSSSSSSPSFFAAPFSSLEQKLSSSLESIHSLITQSLLSSNTSNNNTTSEHPQTHNTTTASLSSSFPVSIKELEAPTSSPSLLVQSCQLKSLEIASQKAQQRIVAAHQEVDHQKQVLQKYQATLLELKRKEEELNVFKKSLCDQLHLLVEDSNRGRSQKLLFVSETYPV